jgi:metallophosphoesterase (TIGR00282 family)
MSRKIKILCVGDVVSQSGCDFLRKKLPEIKRQYNIDVCIVNGENSAVGNGMLPNSCEHIFSSGADMITGGNHSLKRREIFEYLDRNESVLRPANYGDGVWGKGYGIIDKGSYKIGVISLLGRVWLEGHLDPFQVADDIIKELKKETEIIIVDFHAEATAEKKAFGYCFDGVVSAVFGTHTHIQTADAQILSGGTGYITDVGMTGPEESVLGVKKEIIIEKFRKGFSGMFETADTPDFLQGCIFTVEKDSGKTVEINPITVR